MARKLRQLSPTSISPPLQTTALAHHGEGQMRCSAAWCNCKGTIVVTSAPSGRWCFEECGGDVPATFETPRCEPNAEVVVFDQLPAGLCTTIVEEEPGGKIKSKA